MTYIEEINEKLGKEIIELIDSKDRYIGYKGFDKHLVCRGTQYAIGETIVIPGNPEVAANGAHFCQEPLGVDKYYPFNNGYRYCIVEALGKINTDDQVDTRVSTDKLKLLMEIDETTMRLIQIHYKNSIDKKIMEGVHEFQRRNCRLSR